MTPVLPILFTAVVSGIVGYTLSATGESSMSPKKAFVSEEPLLIEGEQQKTYSLLPAGSVLYLDKSWPEGHDTYHVYFHFKGDFKAEPADPDRIAPLWLRTVEPSELPKLLSDYPLSKDELVRILKARKISKAELVQILREWPDELAQ